MLYWIAIISVSEAKIFSVHTMHKKRLRTIDVARQTGVSVNTIHLYEALDYLPPVPRLSNGYRVFTQHHILHVQLVRYAMRCTWVGGKIRQTAFATLKIAAQGNYAEALKEATQLESLVNNEQANAEEALKVLEKWTHHNIYHESEQLYRIGEVAQRLKVTVDELRNWERNGLINVPRAENGYRIYSSPEIDRLLVIRALRRARYSTMSILQLMQHLEQGHTEQLREILDTPPMDDELEQYPTDSWLTTLKNMREAVAGMKTLLVSQVNPP